MIITVSGRPASGKSSVAKLLAKKLHYKHYSSGDLQREVAKELGITITALGELEQKDDAIDKRVDAKTKELAAKEDDLVIDSWLAPCFVQKAFHVFLEGDENVRVERRVMHRRKEETLLNHEQAQEDMRKREQINRERWKRYYSYDYLDKKNYDFVVDTAKLSIAQVVQEILKALPTSKPF